MAQKQYRHPHRCVICNGSGRKVILINYRHTTKQGKIEDTCHACRGKGYAMALSGRKLSDRIYI